MESKEIGVGSPARLSSSSAVDPRKSASFTQPAEWAAHEACWLAWPSHADLWKEDLTQARREFTALCRAIADPDPALFRCRGERLEILVPDREQQALADQALSGLNVRFHLIPFGDIWLRDTGPIFVRTSSGGVAAARFAFNGWGGKYELEHDDQVARRVASSSFRPEVTHEFVMEGGSLEMDGLGTCLTSRQCLLNPNRNPGMTEKQVERALHDSLGVTHTVWITEGLLNDHTDGHIDTLARFARPGVVLCMEAKEAGDPNRKILEAIRRELSEARDARGRRFEIRTVPSPGRILNEDGKLMPASYMNFYIANTTVVVPTYDSPYDDAAVAAIAACFPERKTVGLPALAILTGGGAFHCITQQQPAIGGE